MEEKVVVEVVILVEDIKNIKCYTNAKINRTRITTVSNKPNKY